MKTKSTIRSVFRVLLCTSAVVCCPAQTTDARPNPLVVPEKEMAARLSNFATPTLSKPPMANRCSNRLAILKVEVDKDGKVSNVEFVSGFDELRKPALAAVRQWTYKPYEVKGQAVTVETQVSILYLGDGESFPMYVPDGKNGVKGGDVLPLPSGCGPEVRIKRPPS